MRYEYVFYCHFISIKHVWGWYKMWPVSLEWNWAFLVYLKLFLNYLYSSVWTAGTITDYCSGIIASKLYFATFIEKYFCACSEVLLYKTKWMMFCSMDLKMKRVVTMVSYMFIWILLAMILLSLSTKNCGQIILELR